MSATPAATRRSVSGPVSNWDVRGTNFVAVGASDVVASGKMVRGGIGMGGSVLGVRKVACVAREVGRFGFVNNNKEIRQVRVAGSK